MNTKQILFFGKNGDILNEVQPPFRAPLLEMDINKSLPFRDGCLLFDHQLPAEDLKKYFQSIYRSWRHFGPFGDVIAVKELIFGDKYCYMLDYIGRLAFAKAATAADLMMVIKSRNENFLVGIKRKNEPGKGKLAFPGGFINVNGYNLDTPLQTVIHEAEEEIGLKIFARFEDDVLNYSSPGIMVDVDYHGINVPGELHNLGTFPTGDSEKLPTVGLKRVYTTTAFVLVLHMDIDEEEINSWLKAGDDASDLVIVKFDHSSKPEFGIEHHQKLFNLLKIHLAFGQKK
jgi:ADP-ribose pyrophosphatase YjhB (NUDIX family)